MVVLTHSISGINELLWHELRNGQLSPLSAIILYQVIFLRNIVQSQSLESTLLKAMCFPLLIWLIANVFLFISLNTFKISFWNHSLIQK